MVIAYIGLYHIEWKLKQINVISFHYIIRLTDIFKCSKRIFQLFWETNKTPARALLDLHSLHMCHAFWRATNSACASSTCKVHEFTTMEWEDAFTDAKTQYNYIMCFVCYFYFLFYRSLHNRVSETSSWFKFYLVRYSMRTYMEKV